MEKRAKRPHLRRKQYDYNELTTERGKYFCTRSTRLEKDVNKHTVKYVPTVII